MSHSDDKLFSSVPLLKWILTPFLVLMELMLLLWLSGESNVGAWIVIGGIFLLLAWLIASFWISMDSWFGLNWLSRSPNKDADLFTFEFLTTHLNTSLEDENPINPIYGQSLLRWLKKKSHGRVEMTEPDYEDWGWFSYVNWKGRSYLLGSSSDDRESWIFQMEKHRTFSEKLLGREKMKEGDEAWGYFAGLIQSEPEFHDASSVTTHEKQ